MEEKKKFAFFSSCRIYKQMHFLYFQKKGGKLSIYAYDEY